MRKFIATLILLMGVCVPPVARADIGGSVPSPGGCDYPAVGSFGAAFGEYDYACAFPTEINGSHWQILYGGGMWQVQVTAGVSIMIFNASVSAYIPSGVLRGVAYWACPDLSMSDPPNPPSAWKNYLVPGKCKTVAPMPVLIRDDPAPPLGAPPPPPLPTAIAPPLDGQQPAVTNPDNPNPDATVNK